MSKTYMELGDELGYLAIQRCDLVCIFEGVKQLALSRSCTLFLHCLERVLDGAGSLVKQCAGEEDACYIPF